ncbi:MAG TPA: hypothetical protein VKY74_02025 [Chloroflexia bacterium]|nr:hypothetical protein [Chloroflexia bacterium]
MAIYLAVVGLISIALALFWLVTGAAQAGWFLLATLVIGIGGVLWRIFMARGAPDDKFPWE